MKSYNKNDIAILASKTGFLRDQLEKVIRLSDILTAFYDNRLLRESLVLKGGTAINLTVFDMPRLSVDIDLDYCRSAEKETMMKDRDLITKEIQLLMNSNGYELNPRTKYPLSLDSWVWSYTNAGGNRDVIKIEINYSMRCHVLPTVDRQISIPFLEPFNTIVLSPLELFGSKIKALLERSACRDMYDVDNMINAGLFTADSEREMLRKIVLFYLCVGGSNPPSTTIDFTKINSIRFPQIRSQLIPVLRKTERFDFEIAKQNVVSFITNLMRFSNSEIEFVSKFNSGNYCPELLFDSPEIIECVRNHPMAIWKTMR